MLSKLGSREIPADTMQFLSTLGMLPVGASLLGTSGRRLERNLRGTLFSMIGGGLSAAGIVALIAAYRSGGNTGVITVTTGLYPMVTVALAVSFLKERLTRKQIAGLALAAAAIVMFSW